MKKLVGFATLAALTALALSPSATAFHGSWWKADGVALTLGGVGGQFTAKVDWTGRQIGNQGSVTIKFFQPGNGVPVHQNTLQVREFWGIPDGSGVFIIDCQEIVQPYIHEGLVPGTWSLNGIMRNDLCTGLNDNDYTVTYLGAFTLVLRSAGGFGVTHG